MSDTTLKARIQRLLKEHLAVHGFELQKPRIVQRRIDHLRQGIEFQPGTGHLAGKYAVNVYWSFTHALDEEGTMAVCKRIGELSGSGDRWFSRADSDFDTDFTVVERLVVEVALPYLARYDTVAKIVVASKSGGNEISKLIAAPLTRRLARAFGKTVFGPLSPMDAFGIDEGWRHFNWGYCESVVGNTDAAIVHYQEVVTKHSAHPYDWVRERKDAANKQICQLRGEEIKPNKDGKGTGRTATVQFDVQVGRRTEDES